MDNVLNRRLLLGVTGGIAAYKAAELARLLIRNNVEVRVAMTAAATHFVGPATFQALTGHPVATDLWDEGTVPNAMAHIELSRGVDAILVAPASADFLAKLAHGLADDLLSATCLARNCPLLVAPAMNREMWDNAATQRNIEQLARDGVVILGPAAGDQACGEIGMGRMLEAEELAHAVLAQFGPRRLAGRKVLVTAGPTFEAIDTVRGLTNRSSGKMGYAIAAAALAEGAEVTLVSGPVTLEAPAGANVVRVTTAAEMLQAVMTRAPSSDYFFAVAAVSDYRPVSPASRKIKKDAAHLKLDLEPTEDILARVAALKGGPFCVGFAGESEDVERHAREKRTRKGLPMIVANDVRHAVGGDDNEVTIHDDEGAHVLARASKAEIARRVVEHAVSLAERRALAAKVAPFKQAS